VLQYECVWKSLGKIKIHAIRHLSAEVFFSFFRRQLTAEGTLVVNCSRFLTSVVNCRRGIFVFYMCFSALSYVSTTIFLIRSLVQNSSRNSMASAAVKLGSFVKEVANLLNQKLLDR